MKFKMLGAAFLAAASIFATNAQAQQAQITDNWRGVGYSWERGADLLLRWMPVLVDGDVMICGAYAGTGGSTFNRLNRVVMRESAVMENGTRLKGSLSFFSIVSNAHISEELVGQMASCASLGIQRTQAQLANIELKMKSGRISAP